MQKNYIILDYKRTLVYTRNIFKLIDADGNIRFTTNNINAILTHFKLNYPNHILELEELIFSCAI